MGTVSATSISCQACGAVLKGQMNKKFCNDYCRNKYNSFQKARIFNAV